MIEVELGDLKKVSKEIAELLGQRLKVDVSRKGKLLLLDDNGGNLGVKDVKLQVKHALHQLGFSDEYRVLAEHHMVRITRVESKAKYVEKEGRAPPAAQSLPYFFP